MKKFIVVLVLLFAATVVFGQSINLGSFPVGKWLDANFDAVWEFSANNIRILDSNTGEVYCSFSGLTIQNFKVTTSGMQPVISFDCPETERSYSFKADLPRTGLILEIDRAGLAKYTVNMPKQ
jgi:hypothetical protein